jgi:hypothetical protein
MKLKPFGLSIALAGLFALDLISGSALAQSKKAGQLSCDGALDVIPTKALTFTRKRRPGKEASAPASNAPATTENSPKATRKKSR